MASGEYVTVRVNWVAQSSHGMVRLRRELMDALTLGGMITIRAWSLRVELSKKRPGKARVVFFGTHPNGSTEFLFREIEASELEPTVIATVPPSGKRLVSGM